MPGPAPPARAHQRFPRRMLAYPAQLTLSALMSVAVAVLERRIRKALRPKTGAARRTGQAKTT
jgi:hypothetical protein